MSEQMRLSEAIRLGAMLKPQAFDFLIVTVPAPRQPGDVLGLNGNLLYSCALGAALDAVGLLNTGAKIDDLRQVFTDAVSLSLFYGDVECPACGTCPALYRHNNVGHLNNIHHWTREQIADWVETIENAQTTPAASREEAGTEQETASPAVSFAQK